MADSDDIVVDDESIITFMSATEATAEQAKNYLQIADGDVERAVSLFFESGGDFSPPSNPISTTSTSTHINAPPIPTSSSKMHSNTMEDDDDYGGGGAGGSGMRGQLQGDYRAPIAPKREILTGGGGFGHHEMFDEEFGIGPNPNVMRNLGMGAQTARQTVDPFRNYDREAAIVRGEAVPPPSGRAEKLADMFMPPLDIMYKGSFQQARKKAEDEKKWLMVTLQDSTEFPSLTQNRDLWSKESIKDFIRENFVFLLMSSDSPAGQEHRQFYPFENYPYIAILDPITAGRLKVWSTMLEPDEFIVEVMDFLENGGKVQPPTKPKKKKKPVSELSEEEQLQAALRASLGQSMDEDGDEEWSTGSLAPPDVNGQVKTEPQQSLSANAGASSAGVASPTKANGAVSGAFDMIKPVKRDEPTTGDITRVQIRCPNGERVVRKFLKTDPVRYIFEYVKSSVPGGDKPFDLINVRDPLSKKLDQTLQEASCVSAALTMDFF